MANILSPFGFKPVGVLDGLTPTFGFATRLISSAYATKIFKGDPVVTVATGYVQQASSNTVQVAGVFLGCEYYSIALQTKRFVPFWPGSDAVSDVTAKVMAVPQGQFLVQANGQLLPSHVGMNVGFAIGTGNTANGISGATIDISTVATTNTLPLRIVSLVTNPPLVNGSDQTSPYGFAIVTFNNQDFKSLTGI